MEKINYFNELAIEEYAAYINMPIEHIINTIKWLHNTDSLIETELIIPSKMTLIDWIRATCICHLLENDICDVHIALNQKETINLDEFASIVNMSRSQVLNQILNDDQYGSTNTNIPLAATLDQWIDLSCHCDLLYGFICPIHQNIKSKNNPVYRLKVR